MSINQLSFISLPCADGEAGAWYRVGDPLSRGKAFSPIVSSIELDSMTDEISIKCGDTVHEVINRAYCETYSPIVKEPDLEDQLELAIKQMSQVLGKIAGSSTPWEIRLPEWSFQKLRQMGLNGKDKRFHWVELKALQFAFIKFKQWS